MAVTMMNKMINPEVMGDMIGAKIEALLKITPYAKVDAGLMGVPIPAVITDAIEVLKKKGDSND